jgi:hypothetical protein
MGAPRQGLNPTTNSVGFTAKLVTVRSLSADRSTAVVVDRQNTQTSVPMLVQRSKGPLPAPGDTWLISQDLGMWTFAAFSAPSPASFSVVRVTVSASPPASPGTGDLWFSSANDYQLSVWDGTSWVAAQFGSAAIAPQAGITAGQVNFTASDIGGITVSLSPVQPESPSEGALWYDGQDGYVLKQWNGSSWVPYQYGTGAIAVGSITAELIAADTITAAQIAAGTVIAGSVDGTTITGANFIGTGEGQELILFSGTPADYNMIVSAVSEVVNDVNSGGGTILPGIVYYGNSGGPDGLPVALQTMQFVGDLGLGPNGAAITPYTTTATPPSAVQSSWTAPADTVFGNGITLGSIVFAVQSGLYDLYLSGSVGISGGLTVRGGGISAEEGTPSDPTTITTDTWHGMTLINGYSLGAGGYAEYKLEPDNKVSVRGANIIVGTSTGGTSIWTPPSGSIYVPITPQRVGMFIEVSTGSAGAESPRFDVSSTGLEVQNIPASTTRIGFKDSYALD